MITTALALCQESYNRHDFRVGEVEGILDRSSNGQHVAVRGTEKDLEDVLRDFRCLPWYDRRTGWAHAGFLKGAQGIVDKALFGLLRREEPVYLTGHSMGGSIVVCAAAILQKEGFNVRGVITFGAPRALRRRSLPFPCQQYSNPGDPVPNLPPWWMFGYKHINEIRTNRPMVFLDNHSLSAYKEALI